VIWHYIGVFFNTSWSLAQRAEAASFVLHFLRLWRSWLLHSEQYSLKQNFISRECYEDITISVHNVILIIRCVSLKNPKYKCACWRPPCSLQLNLPPGGVWCPLG
jgi:hypothetical protein